jgi:hypothetical protein
MIKQISIKEAVELMLTGVQVPCLVPGVANPDDFSDYSPTYLNEVLNDVICFAYVPDEPVKTEEYKPVIEKRPKKQGGTDRRMIDMGKVHALKNAGWSVKKIAEEMGTSQATIYDRLKEERENVKEEAQYEVES